MIRENKLGLAPFDASDYLDSDEAIIEYLRIALNNPDPDALIVALRDVAKARGVSAFMGDPSVAGSQQDILGAFQELAVAAGDHWSDVDADEYVHSLRSDD